ARVPARGLAPLAAPVVRGGRRRAPRRHLAAARARLLGLGPDRARGPRRLAGAPRPVAGERRRSGVRPRGWSAAAVRWPPVTSASATGPRPTKHIFVTGGVASGLGKGLTGSSLGRLLKLRGLRVVMQKLDPY